MLHPRYHEWLAHVFGHPETKPVWNRDRNIPSFKASEVDYVVLLEQTFRRSGEDLRVFSDWQVYQGLWYLAAPTSSEYMWALKSQSVPLGLRLTAIRSITTLYRDCFAVRCSETLSHLDQKPCSALNPICYLFWDHNPLSPIEGGDLEPELAGSVFSVLGETFEIGHLACQEAALHGYGEFSCYYPQRVERAVDNLLPNISHPELRAYALRARVGDVL